MQGWGQKYRNKSVMNPMETLGGILFIWILLSLYYCTQLNINVALYNCALWAKIPKVWNPVPLYYCALWAMITKVWNPCALLLLHTVGNDHQGVEPLCPFITAHCGQLSPRCGTPVPLFYCTLWAMITQVRNSCALLILHTVGNDHQGVDPLCPFTTAWCKKNFPPFEIPASFLTSKMASPCTANWPWRNMCHST